MHAYWIFCVKRKCAFTEFGYFWCRLNWISTKRNTLPFEYIFEIAHAQANIDFMIDFFFVLPSRRTPIHSFSILHLLLHSEIICTVCNSNILFTFDSTSPKSDEAHLLPFIRFSNFGCKIAMQPVLVVVVVANITIHTNVLLSEKGTHKLMIFIRMRVAYWNNHITPFHITPFF